MKNELTPMETQNLVSFTIAHCKNTNGLDFVQTKDIRTLLSMLTKELENRESV